MSSDRERHVLAHFNLSKKHIHRIGGFDPKTSENFFGALKAGLGHARPEKCRGGRHAQNCSKQLQLTTSRVLQRMTNPRGESPEGLTLKTACIRVRIIPSSGKISLSNRGGRL
jgi:hypothetical protein